MENTAITLSEKDKIQVEKCLKELKDITDGLSVESILATGKNGKKIMEARFESIKSLVDIMKIVVLTDEDEK